MITKKSTAVMLLIATCISSIAMAEIQKPSPTHIYMKLVDASGVANAVGEITYEDTEFGLLLTPNLTGLTAGLHGFHVHEKPSCAATTVNGKVIPAGAAGGHYDPEKTGHHGSPYLRGGHKGDLPALYVAVDGRATNPVIAPQMKAANLQGKSIMIHVGGDNHTDSPTLGGGGMRMVCGVI